MIYLKGFLFVAILFIAAGLIIYETQSWRITLLLLMCIWASARLYYFMFYVIEKYVYMNFKFASIYSFIKYLFGKK